MIVVNVHLDSAVSRTRDKELARVHISNIGQHGARGELSDYACESMRGRGTTQLDKCIVQRRGKVSKHAREREHVLNLVAKALIAMGYGK